MSDVMEALFTEVSKLLRYVQVNRTVSFFQSPSEISRLNDRQIVSTLFRAAIRAKAIFGTSPSWIWLSERTG